MSQSSVAAYFNKRKRSAVDELANVRSKTIRIDSPSSLSSSLGDNVANGKLIASPINDNLILSSAKLNSLINDNTSCSGAKIITGTSATIRRTSTVVEEKRTPTTRLKQCLRASKRSTSSSQDAPKSSLQPKIVKFTIDESNKEKDTNDEPPPPQPSSSTVVGTTSELFSSKDILNNVDHHGMKTPTKEQQTIVVESAKRISARKNLSLEEIKTKLGKSSKLQDLKASLGRLKQLEEARQKNLAKSGQLKTVSDGNTEIESPKHSIFNRTGRAANILTKGLKEFNTIDLEVLTSPKKGFTTPTKFITPTKSDTGKIELMSPKKSATRRLFSPTKASPSKISVELPAYQRFQSLVDAGKPTLQLPYKYRCLEEAFKCLDTVCSMFFNRHETITMKKLKPAVQRMLRKNFTETHLAQIKHLYPDAYNFYQKKMLNAGSHTKYDYYQLVIVPNIKQRTETKTTATTKNVGNTDNNGDDDRNIIKTGGERIMNPQIMIDRQRELHRLLLNVVKDEHEKFLQTLVPPMTIPKDKLTRWHPEFDINNCTDIQRAQLPLPPNVDKFSSAKDVLSTARNLFNCSTPMERAMDRFEATQRQQELATNTAINGIVPTKPNQMAIDPVSAVLKDVPKSLLERIRAKQAAKALDQMTRRPSQDKEACKFSRLPELARHMRNIFVTERKGCLELDNVLVKLENSFREKMTREMLRELIQLLGKEAPGQWITFHHIRKTDFVKINKEVNLADVIEILRQKAAAKAS